MEAMRVCKRKIACDGSPQPESNFYLRKRDGIRLSECRACARLRARQRRAKRETRKGSLAALANKFFSAPVRS